MDQRLSCPESHRLIYRQKSDRRCPGKASDRPLIRLILMPSFYPMPDLSIEERLILVDHINFLMQPDFEKLMFALNVPNSVIPSGQAAQGNRAIALLQWVKSPGGCGLIELLKTLDAIAPVPLDVDMERAVDKSVPGSQKVPVQPSILTSTMLEMKETVERRVPPQAFQEDLGNGVKLDMVYIPKGKFFMGEPDWKGYHSVEVPAFYMGKYPVTQSQWKAVSTLPKRDQGLHPSPSKFKGGDLPVEKISWSEAVEFCNWLSRHTERDYRLSSESEWEYACRAGTETAYSFGDSITSGQSNFGKNVGKTTPVGTYDPNPFGLYDMHGNVWEWCQDYYHDSYKGAPTDGRARMDRNLLGGRVSRGGSWISNSRNCRSAFRLFNYPGNRYFGNGFRVV
ncbi:MAG: formylglycine-generating enzyme family protein [Cyanobacteria bacterium P01_A01_bin.37]